MNREHERDCAVHQSLLIRSDAAQSGMAVLIHTGVHQLGAEVQWCSASAQASEASNAVAAAVTANSTAVTVHTHEGEPEQRWSAVLSSLTSWSDSAVTSSSSTAVGESQGPTLVLDDSGDLSKLLHEGIKIEQANATDGAVGSASTDSDRHTIAQLLDTDELASDTQRWQRIAQGVQGVVDATAAGAHKLLQLAADSALLVPAMNVSDAVTHSRFAASQSDRVKASLVQGLHTLCGVDVAGKSSVVCGYGDVGKACAAALKAAGSRVSVTEVDPICAVQAAVEGYEVVTLEQAVQSGADVYLTTTGVTDTVAARHLTAMKDGAVVGSIGIGTPHGEIEVAALQDAAQHTEAGAATTRYTLGSGSSVTLISDGKLLEFASNTSTDSTNGGTAEQSTSLFAVSAALATQLLALVEMHRESHVHMLYSQNFAHTVTA
eukprot:5178-Heterococcus_DN1.PRE.3